MNIPLNIDWQQICLHLFNFLILAAALYGLLYKPVRDFMEKRTRFYQQMQSEAAKCLDNAKGTERKYQRQLEQLGAELEVKRKEAKAQTDAYTRQQIEETRQQTEAMLQKAREQIQEERKRVLADTQKEIAGMAVAATKKLLEQSQDDACGHFLKNAEGGTSHE